MLPFRLFYKAMFFVYTVAYVKILVKRTKIRNISYTLTLWTLSIYIYYIYYIYTIQGCNTLCFPYPDSS